MSNQKKNNAKEKCLTEAQRLKKEEMLCQMQREIQRLEFKIKFSKMANLKINMLKGLKIFLRAGQLIAPYVLTAGIIVSGFSVFGCTPFIKDNRKQKLEKKKEFDSFGNVCYEQQYEHFDNTQGTISYFGKWSSVDGTFYSREVKTYQIDKSFEEIVEKIVNDNVNTSLLETMFGEPTSSFIQTKNNLTEEELQEPAFLQAAIYSEVDNDFIIVKESTDDNIGLTVLCLLITIVGECLAFCIRDQYSTFDFSCRVAEIKKQYPLVDVEELSKKLEIRKDNYTRLTR